MEYEIIGMKIILFSSWCLCQNDNTHIEFKHDACMKKKIQSSKSNKLGEWLQALLREEFFIKLLGSMMFTTTFNLLLVPDYRKFWSFYNLVK